MAIDIAQEAPETGAVSGPSPTPIAAPVPGSGLGNPESVPESEHSPSDPLRASRVRRSIEPVGGEALPRMHDGLRR
jgi:hypothetical protein